MNVIAINYTEKRELTLIRIKAPFEIVEGTLMVKTNYSRDFYIELLDSL